MKLDDQNTVREEIQEEIQIEPQPTINVALPEQKEELKVKTPTKTIKIASPKP